MKWMDFNEHWTCRHLEDEGDGLPVRIPDDAMLREKRTAQALGGLNVGWFEGHDYLYKKHFSLSTAQADMHHVLAFDGVYRCAEVWLNGKKAAFRPYGYTTFTVDCDDFLTEGDNTVGKILFLTPLRRCFYCIT